jgi:RHS repeat-associated protein
LNYSTTYTYDALNNITSVTQGTETRTFVYDELSRLTSATNPESGTTTYTYDAASNVATRTDARNIATTYAYDSLNRLTQKTYSDGTPGAYFYYDQTSWNGISLSNTIGRLTSQGRFNGTSWLNSSGFSYDSLGRVTNNPQDRSTMGVIEQVPYTYDLLGDTITYGNGAGVTFSQTFNPAGLPTQLTSSYVDSQHPGTLVSGAHYNGAGGGTSYVLGNNLTATVAYNGLVQPCRINVNSSGTLVSSCTGASPSGNLLDLTMGFNYGSADNGNVMSWAAAGQQTFNRSYTYDGVNRVSTMSAPGDTCSGLSWSYDQWCNRTGQNVTGGTCSSPQFAFSANRITSAGFQYDAAGNMTHDANHSYTYDAENRIVQVDGGSTATYGYDADGGRASKMVGGVETDYLYDLAGHPITEYGGGCGATCWSRSSIYFNEQMLSEYFVGSTYFVSTDHLGSTRVVTNLTGGVVDSLDYLPFGEQIAGGSTTLHKFTGYERDGETGLDNAQARYNSSSLGRFMSPDPVGNFIADPTNPQTWNMYAYVDNNPLSLTDPTGMDNADDYDGECLDDFALCAGPAGGSIDLSGIASLFDSFESDSGDQGLPLPPSPVSMPGQGSCDDASVSQCSPNMGSLNGYIPGGCMSCLPNMDPYDQYFGDSPIEATVPTSFWDKITINNDPWQVSNLGPFTTTWSLPSTVGPSPSITSPGLPPLPPLGVGTSDFTPDPPLSVTFTNFPTVKSFRNCAKQLTQQVKSGQLAPSALSNGLDQCLDGQLFCQ